MRTLKMPICGNAYVAEAIACYENGNHATIYTVDPTTEESDAKLMGALRELKPMFEKTSKNVVLAETNFRGGFMTENRRIALVSGGNRGIGLEIVRQLADKGITTILGSRDEEHGRAAAEELPDNVVVRQLDVADEKSVDRLATSIEEEFERLDILVNNAGIANDRGQRGVDADLDRVREALEPTCSGRGGCARRLSRSCSATATAGSSTSPAVWAHSTTWVVALQATASPRWV